jgi:precorrin-6x reductase
MPTVIATHDVKDTAHWLASPKRAEVFATVGVTNIRTFVNPQNRNRVGLILDVPDMDAMMTMLESDAAKAAEEYDGVLAETIEIFIEE